MAADLKSMTKKAGLELIRQGLKSSDAWCIRGLVVIYSFQTDAEQATQCTAEDNGVGFNGVDAEILSSFAEQYQKWGRLSEKQMGLLRKKMPKYARQLLLVARGEIQAPA